LHQNLIQLIVQHLRNPNPNSQSVETVELQIHLNRPTSPESDLISPTSSPSCPEALHQLHKKASIRPSIECSVLRKTLKLRTIFSRN